jgi:hypothetical protein
MQRGIEIRVKIFIVDCSNTLCIWYISAPEDYAVEANFDDETFAIETHTYCSYDYVIIYDGKKAYF